MSSRQKQTDFVLSLKIRSKLRRIIWHYKLLAALKGLMIFAWGSLAVLLGIILIASRFNDLPQLFRWIAFCVWAGGAFFFFSKFFLLRLVKGFSLTHAAMLVDSNHSELQERISSTVELHAEAQDSVNAASKQLIDALSAQADKDIRRIRSFLEISPLALLIPFVMLVAFSGLMLFSFWSWPQQTRYLITSVLLPGANIPSLMAVDMVISPDSDSVVLEGEKINVRMTVKTGDVRTAQIDISESVAPGEKTFIMEKLNEHQPIYGYTLTAKSASLRYRINCNGAKSRWYTVRVIPRPAVERIDISYGLPEYTQIKPITIPQSTGDIENLAQTQVALRITCKGLLDSAQMLLNGENFKPAEITTDGSKTVCDINFTLDENTSGLWKLRMVNHVADRTVTTDESQAHKITIMRDSGPLVDIENPKILHVDMKPDGKLCIDYRLRDDFAVFDAALEAQLDDGQKQRTKLQFEHIPVNMPGAMQQYTGSTAFDLSALNLSGTQKIAVILSATDNSPTAQTGYSKPIIITLKNSAQSPQMQTIEAQEKSISQELEKSIDKLEQARQKNRELKEQIESGSQPKANHDTADRITRQLEDIQKDIRKLADSVEKNSQFDVSGDIRDTAANEVENARSTADSIQPDQSPAQQEILSRELDKQIQQAQTKLGDVSAKVSQMSELARKSEQMNELAGQAQQLQNSQNPTAVEQQLKGQLDKLSSEIEAAKADLSFNQNRSAGELSDSLSQIANRQDRLSREINKMESASDPSQQQIRDMQSLQNPDSSKAAAQQQKSLSNETSQIAQQLKDISSSQTSRQLSQVQQQVQQAAQLQQQAAESLENNQTAQAVGQQQAAARTLNQSARILQKIAPQFQQTPPPQQLQPPSTQLPEQLDIQEISELLQQIQSQGLNEQSAQKLRRIAGEMMQAAKQMGLQASMLPQGIELQNPQEQKPMAANNSQLPDIDLKSMSIGPDDWARLPGKLKTQLLQSSGNTGPEAYRKQIGDYYKALSNIKQEE